MQSRNSDWPGGSHLSGHWPERVRFAIVVAVLWLGAPVPRAQCEIRSVYSDPDAAWVDMALYRAGGKLFVADRTGERILVFDSGTLARTGEIPLTGLVATRPRSMAIHEGSARLFVVVDNGSISVKSWLVVIDADTYQVQILPDSPGYELVAAVDQDRSRLYLFGDNASSHPMVWAIDVQTLDIAGSHDFGFQYFEFNREGGGGINPVTGELVFTHPGGDTFVVVDPATVTGTVIQAAGSSGWSGIWNHLENKIYITTTTWEGYFSYDRDTATPGFAGCVNDGTSIYFNERTNRVYSSAEVDRRTAVIEGATDACQEVEIGGGLTYLGFTPTKHHIYFAGSSGFMIVQEDTLVSLAFFSIPVPGCSAVSEGQLLVDPGSERVYIRSNWDIGSSWEKIESSCVLVMDDLAPLITRQPESQMIRWGGVASLKVTAAGAGTLHYHWYRGSRGDTSRPVGGDSPTLTTQPLLEAEQFWVRISDDLGQGDSREAWVAINPAPGDWVPQESHAGSDLNAVFFVDASTGWVVGDNGTIRRTIDGGAEWITQTCGTRDDLDGVCFLDASNGWVVGEWGTILKTTDGGVTWVPQSSGVTFELWDVAFPDTQTGWVVGEMQTVLTTTDGGTHWGPGAQRQGSFNTIAFLDANKGWLAGNDAAIIATTDGGATWTHQFAPTCADFRDSHFSGPDTGWLVGGAGKIFHTVDGGSHWMPQGPGLFPQALNGVAIVDDLSGWVVGADGLIARTADGGGHWFQVESGTTKQLNEICFISPAAGWVVGEDGTILAFRLARDPADVNGDGTVDSLDLTVLAAVLAENPASWADASGDLDGNGRLDVQDLLWLGLFLL